MKIVKGQEHWTLIGQHLDQIDDLLDSAELQSTGRRRIGSPGRLSGQQAADCGPAWIARTAAKVKRLNERAKRPGSLKRMSLAMEHRHAALTGRLDRAAQ